MATPTQHGYLLLADITGYTAYLAGVDLDHAHGILTDLLETGRGDLRGVPRSTRECPPPPRLLLGFMLNVVMKYGALFRTPARMLAEELARREAGATPNS